MLVLKQLFTFIKAHYSIVNVMPQLGLLITDDSRVIIYNHNVFIQQATGHLILIWTAEFPRTGKANTI
jgi:hypothetical protein